MASVGKGRFYWALACGVAALLAAARTAGAEMCLPSLAEGGRRLHEMPAPSVLWLELLLRQHEACWSADGPHRELRVFLYGNSAVLGHPEPVEDTAGEHLNQLWKQSQLPAHVFNFGFVTAHAMKDMLIVHESLRYHPDVLVYGSIPSDFSRYVAARYTENPKGPYNAVVRFMRNSASRLRQFADESPPGLGRQLELYRRRLASAERRWWRPRTWPVREVLTFAYTAIATRVRAAALRFGMVDPPGEPRSGKIAGPYQCAETRERNERDFRAWGDINTLAYLASVRDRTGIPVVVVEWPIAHEPSEECYNSYVTDDLVRGYRAWLRAEADRLHLPLIDLSRTLLPRDFLDTLHPNARGQRKIAYAMAPPLEPVIRRRIAEVLPAAQPH